MTFRPCRKMTYILIFQLYIFFLISIRYYMINRLMYTLSFDSSKSHTYLKFLLCDATKMTFISFWFSNENEWKCHTQSRSQILDQFSTLLYENTTTRWRNYVHNLLFCGSPSLPQSTHEYFINITLFWSYGTIEVQNCHILSSHLTANETICETKGAIRQ